MDLGFDYSCSSCRYGDMEIGDMEIGDIEISMKRDCYFIILALSVLLPLCMPCL